MNERNAYSRFVNAVRKGFVPLSQNTINDDRVVKWAYNVALTRFHEVWEPTRQKFIAPMADMVSFSPSYLVFHWVYCLLIHASFRNTEHKSIIA